MDMTQYIKPELLVLIPVCLIIGLVIKHTEAVGNKYIPLIMGALGVALNVWINMGITPQILLGGLFSGLASTGMHQVFKNLINKED